MTRLLVLLLLTIKSLEEYNLEIWKFGDLKIGFKQFEV